MKILTQLRNSKAQLVRSAAAKLASLDGVNADQARAIESEHADLLTQIRAMDELIARACEDDKKARKARAESDEDEEDDDEDDDDQKKDKKDRNAARAKKRANHENDGDDKRMSRAVFAEMNTVDTQARSFGIDIDLAGALERNEKPDDLRRKLFAALAQKSKKGPEGGDGTGLQITRDERDGVKEAMELALITRMLQARGQQSAIKYEPKDIRERARVEQYRKQSEQYLPYGLVDIAAACIDYK